MQILFAVALWLSPAAAGQTVYENFPLDSASTGAHSNNIWAFVEDSQGYLVEPTNLNVVQVSRGAYLGGGWYNHDVQGLLGGLGLSLYDQIHGKSLWNFNGQTWSVMLDYAAKAGRRWPFRVDACHNYNVEAGARATVQTPAGEFAGARAFAFEQNPDANVRCPTSMPQDLLTAPGVGPIAYSTGGHKGHLLYARINDEVIAGPGETRVHPNKPNLVYTLALASEQISSTQIQCIRAPCNPLPGTLQFVLTVTNTVGQAESVSFNSGARFDLDVFDADGTLVKKWSDGKMFTMALSTVSVQPGETKVFYGTMPFADRSGAALQGKFRVVGYMLGGAPKLSGNVTAQ